MKILARREHTRHELTVKLASRNISAAIIEIVLQRLSEQGLQNDERAASVYIRQHVSKGYGERKVRAELLQKGIDGKCIDDCLADAQIDWQEIAERVFNQKFAPILCTDAGIDQKLLMKQQRFLLSRGFSTDVIKNVLLVNR